jgi:hypothetical protein
MGEQREGSIAHRVPDLGALELLLAVARLGSLGGAARELGITQPAPAAGSAPWNGSSASPWWTAHRADRP